MTRAIIPLFFLYFASCNSGEKVVIKASNEICFSCITVKDVKEFEGRLQSKYLSESDSASDKMLFFERPTSEQFPYFFVSYSFRNDTLMDFDHWIINDNRYFLKQTYDYDLYKAMGVDNKVIARDTFLNAYDTILADTDKQIRKGYRREDNINYSPAGDQYNCKRRCSWGGGYSSYSEQAAKDSLPAFASCELSAYSLYNSAITYNLDGYIHLRVVKKERPLPIVPFDSSRFRFIDYPYKFKL